MLDARIFISVIFGGIGLLFLVIGFIAVVFFRKRRENASAITTARVAGIEWRRGNDRGGCYYPIFEYYANGCVRRVASSFGSNPCRYKEGEEVEIHYNTQKPEQIWAERDEGMKKLFCGIFIGIGGLFFVIGVVMGISCRIEI